MIPKTKLTMTLVAGAILCAASGLSMADEAASPAGSTPSSAPHHCGPGRMGEPGHIYSQLGLSAEQQASIKAIRTAAEPQMKSLHQQLRANHLKLMQTKPDDANYGNVVAEVAQSNATLESQRTSQMAEVRAQMYAVLTPAQKTQLAALEAKWGEHAHHAPWGQHAPPADGGSGPST
jgi:Spy/CpxP family protein refolding chaperone